MGYHFASLLGHSNRVSAQTCKLQPRRLLVSQKSVIFWKKSLTRQCSKIRRRKVQFSSVKSGILEKNQHSALPTADPVGLRQNSSRYSILESPFPFLAREREYNIMYASKVLYVSPATDTYAVRMLNSNAGQQFSKNTQYSTSRRRR